MFCAKQPPSEVTANAVTPRRVEMKALNFRLFASLVLGFAMFTLPVSALDPVVFVGEFSHMRQTAEHAYGYSVQIWRQGDKLFGLFSDTSGLSGDTPTGILEDVEFDPQFGKVSFSAKLSVASIYTGNGKQQPTHDLFTFRGMLAGNLLSGVLEHTDKLHSNSQPTTSKVRLVRDRNPSMIECHTYAEWKQSADQILRFRGPKW
jgi:hypothetical protein